VNPAEELAAAANLLRSHTAVAVACHEAPDGDALGSVLGLARALRDGGWDVAAWVPGGGALPRDYAWLGLEELGRTPPGDLDGRLLVALDCGNALRLGPEGPELVTRARATLNVDHHADNTRFADLDVVVPEAPCTTVLVRRLLEMLGLPLEPGVALPLFVGLVTDTGGFAYANAGVEAHREAILLIEAGVEPDAVFRALYEGNPIARVRLLARALDRVELRADGRLASTWITRADLEECGAQDSDSEGIINHLRGIEGVDVAVFLREPDDPARGAWKGSLRAGRPDVDVAAIAHAFGGGGHTQAAGFSTGADLATTLTDLEREIVDAG